MFLYSRFRVQRSSLLKTNKCTTCATMRCTQRLTTSRMTLFDSKRGYKRRTVNVFCHSSFVSALHARERLTQKCLQTTRSQNCPHSGNVLWDGKAGHGASVFETRATSMMTVHSRAEPFVDNKTNQNRRTDQEHDHGSGI